MNKFSFGEEKAFQQVPEWPFWAAIAVGGIVLFIVFELIGCK